MSVKDYLRILWRRKWIFLVTSAAAFCLFVVFTKVQPAFYTARSKVLVAPPQALALSGAANLLRNPENIQINTWMHLIRGNAVRDRVKAYFSMFAYPEGSPEYRVDKDAADDDARTLALVKEIVSGLSAEDREALLHGSEDWIGRIGPEIVERTTLIQLGAEAPTYASAIALANIYALAAQEYSTELANGDLIAAKQDAAKASKDHTEAIGSLQAQIDEAQAGPYPGIMEEYQRRMDHHQTTMKEIYETEGALVRLKEQREALRKRRMRLSHSVRSDIPTTPREFDALASTDPQVLALQDEITRSEREFAAVSNRYTPEHPKYQALSEGMHLLRSQLSNAKIEAAGRRLDEEEYAIMTKQNDLLNLPDKLRADLKKIRQSIYDLSGEYNRVKSLKDQLLREEDSLGQIRVTVARFGLVEKIDGYIRVVDKQQADYAILTRPRNNQFYFIGAIISALAGAFLSYLFEQLDTKIRTDYDVRRHLNLSLVAAIPKVRPDDLLLLDQARESFLAESFDTLATILPTLSGDRPLKTLLVVSTNPEEGKTTMSVNTAIAAARQGRRVLLVDADLRVPMIHSILKLPNQIGFSTLLSGQITEQEADKLYHDAGIENLRVICSGPSPDNPYALLDPQRVRPILEQLQQHFDLIILDTPPLLRTGDAVKLASLADGVLLVVGAYETDQRQASWAKRLLENVNARILGVLLNKTVDPGEQYYYYYASHYGYYYKSTRNA